MDYFNQTRKLTIKFDKDGSVAAKVNWKDKNFFSLFCFIFFSKNKNENKNQNLQLKTPKVSIIFRLNSILF